MYGTPPKIIFDKKTLPFRKEISNKYVDLCNKRPTPKHLKIARDFLEEEVEALFGPSIIMNKYRYCHINDDELIARIENLFMVTHQRTQVPNTHIINKAEVKGIICKRKGKDVNWCVHTKWTIRDQLHQLQCFEVVHSGKINLMLDSDKFEHSKGNEKEN